MVLVLLSALVKGISVSRVRDFFSTKCFYLSARVKEKSLLAVAEGPPAVTLGLTRERL